MADDAHAARATAGGPKGAPSNTSAGGAKAAPSHSNIASGSLTERRFLAEGSERSNVQALIGGVGAAALGAGTYATWVHDTPMSFAPYLFGVGTLAVIIAAVMSSSDTMPLRVGAAGVAIERGGAQPERIAWYEIEKVGVEANDRVVVEGAKKRIVAPISHHAAAAAWILKEALERVPKRVTTPLDQLTPLLRAADDHAEVVPVEPMQLAGRRCKASDVIISFERDARACTRCGEVYDKKHTPEKCLTCEAPMAST